MTTQVQTVEELTVQEWTDSFMGSDGQVYYADPESVARPDPPKPKSVRERIMELCASVGKDTWSDAEAIAVGQAVVEQDGANRDEARRDKERKISKAVDNAFSGVYVTWALIEQHKGDWWQVGFRALGGMRHTWENKLSGMMAIHPELREAYKVWPTFYVVIGTALKGFEAQENVLSWAEQRLLSADEEIGNPITTAYLEALVKYMADNGLTVVPPDEQIPSTGKNAKDEQQDTQNAYKEGVAILAGLVDRIGKKYLDLAVRDMDEYEAALTTVNTWKREAKSVTDALGVRLSE
jgi:hypothetical protein